MSKRLENKVAIITGSSSGIGAAAAIRFAQEGCDLVLAARRENRLEETAEACRAFGVRAVVVPADLTKHDNCRQVVDAAIKEFGKIDILVNNAGIADKHRPITECSDEWWDEVIAIDQSSLFYLTKDVLPYMIQAKSGSIINVSSIGGVFGTAGIAYSSAKSAVLGFTKNVAIQVAPQNIRCNAVCPGPTPTELNTPENMKTFTTWFADQTAQHMNMTLPESDVADQANAILFFASEESVAVTGQVLVVDHGITL